MAEASRVVQHTVAAVTELASRDGAMSAQSAELIAALRTSGAGRLLGSTHGQRPVATLDEFVAVVLRLAALDGSLGWLAATVNGAARGLAELLPAAADEIWGRDPTAVVTGGRRPGGRVERGSRLTGRWSAVAGGEHADWLVLGVGENVDENDVPGLVLVARGDVEVTPGRDTTGLSAAGLCEVAAAGAPIVADRIGFGRPVAPVIGAGAAAAVAGAADGMWRTRIEQVRTHLATSYGSEEITDLATTQAARAAADIDAAGLQIAASLRQSAPAARRAQLQAAGRARDAADRVLGISRRHALQASDPVARLWQDVHLGLRLMFGLLDKPGPR